MEQIITSINNIGYVRCLCRKNETCHCEVDRLGFNTDEMEWLPIQISELQELAMDRRKDSCLCEDDAPLDNILLTPHFAGFFRPGVKLICAHCNEWVDANRGCPACPESPLLYFPKLDNLKLAPSLKEPEGAGREHLNQMYREARLDDTWRAMELCQTCMVTRLAKDDPQGLETICHCGYNFYPFA